MAAGSFFLGRFPRLGRLLVSLGFGPSGDAPATNVVPCVHAAAPVGVVESVIAAPVAVISTAIGVPAAVVATTIAAPVGVVATAVVLEEC